MICDSFCDRLLQIFNELTSSFKKQEAAECAVIVYVIKDWSVFWEDQV